MRLLIVLCLGGLLFAENVYRLPFYGSDYMATTQLIKDAIPKGSTTLASETYWLGLKDHVKFTGLLGFLYQRMFKNAGIFPEYQMKLDTDYIVADDELKTFLKDRMDYIHNNYHLVSRTTDFFYGSSNYLTMRSPKPMIIDIYELRARYENR